MDKVFEIATGISTPLMLAGFIAAVFFFLIRQIIKKEIFPQLTKQVSGTIITLVIQRLFILALIAMILGFVSYTISQLLPAVALSKEEKEHYELPAEDLLTFKLQNISAIDLLPKPEMKNVVLEFKVIPKSKNKYVPLGNKADFILIDSINKETTYHIDINVSDEGIQPKVPSTIVLDGLISKEDYNKLIEGKNYNAKCVFFYDSDIVATKVKFETEIFAINSSTITDLSR